MTRPKRLDQSTAAATRDPPATLAPGWVICRVNKAEGKNLYSVVKPDATTLLVELPARFRSTIWVRRGSFVVVDTCALGARENKLAGEVQNVVGDEKAWRKMGYWPNTFPKRNILDDQMNGGTDDDGPRMPPEEDDSEEDEED